MARTKIWDLSKLPDAVKKSICWADVCRELGRPPGGTSQATIIRWAAKLQLPTDHFISKIGNYRANKTRREKRISNANLFVENSSYPRCKIRRRILEQDLLSYQCECGNTGEWRGKKLSLQLEHKNGIGNDHRLENLCWLCPNCHSQTESWGGRNTVRVKIC